MLVGDAEDVVATVIGLRRRKLTEELDGGGGEEVVTFSFSFSSCCFAASLSLFCRALFSRIISSNERTVTAGFLLVSVASSTAVARLVVSSFGVSVESAVTGLRTYILE